MKIDEEQKWDDEKKVDEPRDSELGSHFLKGDFVVFKAENKLFRVPLYQFTGGSEVFQTLFSLPAGNEEVQGRSETDPIVLPPTISADDFGNFMKVLYPQGTCSWFTFPKAVWISTLKLSSMWFFLHFRNVAIQRLSEKNRLWDVPPTERVVLARTYKVPQWLLQGLRELAGDRVLVSHSDAKIIGFETAFKLAHITFGADKPVVPVNKTLSTAQYCTLVEPRVDAVFDAEVQELRREASTYAPDVNQG
ncbi:hypothetical protein M413DRAFT_447717 [Hebeloma cylindrosporum]|uniref:BTB domain-containing protein n=1 Tax=Hebeloma cylindrosporum TaxID=76867 RepID=A0A0C2XL42_HEBCY|nr:hypothetical protein M413DRAFT_447717 [Hebeloma cylindrosporum h7]